MSSQVNSILRKIRGGKSSEEDLAKFKDKIALLKKSIKREHIDDNLPESFGPITKKHKRYANSVISRGKLFGETVDRLPIQKTKLREDKSRNFEGGLLALVEKYGPKEAFNHMTMGQLIKYQFVQLDLHHCGIRNEKTKEFEWKGKTNE